jgi:predicted AAA+ superfamily ATPase
MKLIKRNNFINQLKIYQDSNLIKIATGIRRCGKSSVFELFIEDLLSQNTNKLSIQSYNMEMREYSEFLSNWKSFYDYIISKSIPNQTNYIFIDEVQNIKDFEHFIDALFVNKNINLFVTGSNAFLSSSEFATLLTGRYIDISVYTFSFSEYLRARKIDIDVKSNLLLKYFQEYLYGSTFPETISFSDNNNAIHKYANTLFENICTQDIFNRHLIKEKNKSNFFKVTKFVIDNIGSQTSSNNIANSLTADGIKITDKTVSEYIDDLCQSYVLYRADRFDIKGKNILSTLPKYYLSDPGFYYSILGHTIGENIGHLLENVVYLELLKRQKQVYIGKIYDNEIDFVAINNDGTIEYYQVALTVTEAKVKDSEISPFKKLHDNYPKILLTTDAFTSDINGYQHKNVYEWLLQDN